MLSNTAKIITFIREIIADRLKQRRAFFNRPPDTWIYLAILRLFPLSAALFLYSDIFISVATYSIFSAIGYLIFLHFTLTKCSLR